MPVYFFRSFCALEIGATEIVFARFALRRGRWRLGTLIRETRVAGGDIAPVLARLRARAGRGGRVTLVLPPQMTLTKCLPMPRMPAAKQDKVIRFAAQEAIPQALAEVAWDHSVVPDSTVAGQEEVLLGAAKLAHVQPLVDAAGAAGFDVAAVLPAQVALYAAVRGAGERGAPPVLAAEVRPDACALVLLDGRRLHMRAFRLDEEGSAESRSARARALDDRASVLAREITRTCVHFEREGRAQPRRVVLAGTGAEPAAFADLLAGRLGLPVGRFDPLAAVDAAPAGAAEAGENLRRWPGLAGAALIESNRALPRLDFLPPGLRDGRELRRRLAWALAAAVLVVAALLPPALHYRALEAGLDRRVAATEAAIAPLRTHQAENRARLERLAALQRQIATLQSVQERRTGWRSFLADLHVRVGEAEEVWLERLELIPGDPPRVFISGCMLDRSPEGTAEHHEAFARVGALLDRMAESSFVSAVEDERFRPRKPGVLQFDFVLVGKAGGPL